MNQTLAVPREWWKLGRKEFGADVAFFSGDTRVGFGVGVHRYRLGDDAMFWCGDECDGHRVDACDRVECMVFNEGQS